MSHPDSRVVVEKEMSEEAKLLLELRERFEQSKKEDAEKAAILANLEGVTPAPAVEEKRKLSPRLHHKRSHWIPI